MHRITRTARPRAAPTGQRRVIGAIADIDRGSGLRGLIERLAAIEGRLDMESPPGRGTTIRVSIPCRRRPGAPPRGSPLGSTATTSRVLAS
jgi:hypothetical protein